MMAAARFPEAQADVHAQLDTVVGRDAGMFPRLPFLGDKDVMTWVSADVCGMDVTHGAASIRPRSLAMETS